MHIVVIGAGAMGASYGGLLARKGHEVTFVDTWQEHIEAINRHGLRLEGARGEHTIPVRATTGVADVAPADLVICFVDSNNTAEAAETAKQVLAPEGYAITFQNGIGNVERLQTVLGSARVVGGSSMCSAALLGPGHVALTHHALTSVGETNGSESERVRALADVLNEAGFETRIDRDIMGTIWTKFALNCAINAICATTGLRLGEMARVPELSAFQDNIITEVLAVCQRKRVHLTDPDLRATVKKHCRSKFSKPSMLQHVEAGKRTEIDSLNGALVREAKTLSMPLPYNESLVALLKGREVAEMRRRHMPDIDYEAWEAQVAAGEEASAPPRRAAAE